MSRSPGSAEAASSVADYEGGWVALHKLLREGGSFSGRERHCAFANLGAGPDGVRFADVSTPSGLDFADDGRAAARVDWDLDGDLDLVLTSRQAPRVRILRNDQTGGRGSLALKLEGARERDAIGARVSLTLADGTRRATTLRAGEGYLAQSSKWVHLGLGDSRPQELLVQWPAGELERFEGAGARGRFVLREGSGRVEPAHTEPLERGPRPAGKGPAAGPGRTRVVLAARPRLPTLALVDAEGADARPGLAALGVALPGTAPQGTPAPRPALLVLWASWCPPCLEELGSLAGDPAELAGSDVALVAVGADDPADRAGAAALLAELGWEHPACYTGPEALEVLDTYARTAVDLRRRLPLPSSVLLDAEGRLAAIYRGPLEPARVAADVARLRGDAGERRAAATPFPGRWHGPPPEVDERAFESALAERGLEREARELSLAQVETNVTTRSGILIGMGKVRAEQGQLEAAAAAFAEAAELEPRSFEAWSYLGTALHQLGRPAEAVAAYDRALALDPRHGDTRFNLALARLALGEPDEARREVELLRVHAPALATEAEAVLRAAGH